MIVEMLRGFAVGVLVGAAVCVAVHFFYWRGQWWE